MGMYVVGAVDTVAGLGLPVRTRYTGASFKACFVTSKFIMSNLTATVKEKEIQGCSSTLKNFMPLANSTQRTE